MAWLCHAQLGLQSPNLFARFRWLQDKPRSSKADTPHLYISTFWEIITQANVQAPHKYVEEWQEQGYPMAQGAVPLQSKHLDPPHPMTTGMLSPAFFHAPSYISCMQSPSLYTSDYKHLNCIHACACMHVHAHIHHRILHTITYTRVAIVLQLIP